MGKQCHFQEKPRPLPTVRRPELNGIKWQQMALFTKIRIWDDATSYKQSVENGVICAKACKNPIFPGQTMPFSGKAPALTNGPATGTKWHQMATNGTVYKNSYLGRCH
jgi:hypothetical protein